MECDTPLASRYSVLLLVQPFYGPFGTIRVSQYQKKHSPTHHPDHHPISMSFFHLPRSIASSRFKLCAWLSFCKTSFHVLFGLPLGLELSTSYSIHFFTQSLSSFRSTCPYHHRLFYCSINIITSIPSLSLKSLLGTLFYLNIITHPSDHSHLCSLKCHLVFFPDRPGIVLTEYCDIQYSTVYCAVTPHINTATVIVINVCICYGCPA